MIPLSAVVTAIVLLALGVATVSGRAIYKQEQARDRAGLPGSLGEQSWDELDDWEQHVWSTPGLADWSAWEAEFSQVLPIYDIEENQ